MNFEPEKPCDKENDQTIKLIKEYQDQYPGSSIIALFSNEDKKLYINLLELKNISGLIVPDNVDVKPDHTRIGHIYSNKRGWHIPECQAKTIIVLGQRHQISFFMLNKAITKGIYWVAYLSLGRLVREYIPSFSFNIAINKLYQILPSYIFPGFLFYKSEKKLKELINSQHVPLLKENEFKKGHILLVNSSLLWGGAERQIVNTLTGLHSAGYKNISLLCQRLDSQNQNDFYLSALQKKNIKVYELSKDIKNITINKRTNGLTDDSNDLEKKISFIFSKMPRYIASDVVDYITAFDTLRPQVVHIWQDSTSVLAGLAAAIIGIPRIVLSSRNMAPYRFHYHMPYMRYGYRALANNSHVQFINNSNAGKEDYENWLGMRQGKYKVLFNGVSSNEFKKVPREEIESYRNQLGIPKNTKVIGSIFRFYKEKDPVLWLDTLAEVAKKDSNCVFLLIGTGPLQLKIHNHSKELGLSNRLYMPGTEKKTVLPLSLMDVFLLTSRQEGTPNVVIEAQMCGVPVVTTSAGGTADTIIDGKTGWVVNKRSPVLLAARVLYCINNSEWADKAMRLSREFAIDRFDMGRMINETIKIYGINNN